MSVNDASYANSIHLNAESDSGNRAFLQSTQYHMVVRSMRRGYKQHVRGVYLWCFGKVCVEYSVNFHFWSPVQNKYGLVNNAAIVTAPAS